MKIQYYIILGLGLMFNPVNATNTYSAIKFAQSGQLPDKTICIKHAQGNDANVLFSSVTELTFEIYKPGNEDQLNTIIDKLNELDEVESVSAGNKTGDYQAITIVLKKKENKQWFVQAFKQAGLSNIKLNNSEVKALEKI